MGKFYPTMESPLPNAGASPGEAGRRRGGDAASALAAVALMAVLYWWTAGGGPRGAAAPGGNTSLLNLQVEAFHAGHLSLNVAPDARLLGASDPYDPAVNRGTRLLDAVLYRGKYYTYFGPAPLLVLMWPWFEAFGSHPPPGLTAFIFGAGAFAFQAAFLLYAKRRWFPDVRTAWLAVALTAVGAGNLLQPLLRAHSTFDIPILSELLFASAAAFFAALALGAGSRSLGAWSAASLCFGLAAASRPNVIPAGAALLLAFWLGERRGERRTSREFAARLATASMPAVLCLCGLFAYNLARFGNPLDFGNTHTLVEVDWRQRTAFSARYVLANLFYYAVSVPRLSAYFPYFVDAAPLPFTPPAGYLDYVDRLAGFLPAYPFALVGILAWAGIRGAVLPRGFSVLVTFLASLAVLIAAPILCFIGPSLRYQAEMAFPLLLLAGLGTLQAGRLFRGTGRAAGLATGVAVLALGTGLSNFLMGCASYGYFRAADPGGYQATAAAFNGLSYPVERALGWEPTIPTLRLRFPSDRTGGLEPLWVSGRVPEADFLYVYYATPHAIQIGFESMGRGGPVSDLIPLDYSQEHALEIAAGPFLPPASHPYFARMGLGSGHPLPDLLRVTLDGRVVVDAIVSFYDGRGLSSWGSSADELAFGRRFTGHPFSVAWAPFNPSHLEDLFRGDSYGDVILGVKWPASHVGGDEPLLSIGEKNSGELVFVRFDGTGMARVGIRARDGVAIGEPFAVAPQGATVRISAPALYPGADWASLAPLGRPPGRNTVCVDGRGVLDAAAPRLWVGPHAVVPGRNTLLAGAMAPEFSGTIESVSRQWAPR